MAGCRLLGDGVPFERLPGNQWKSVSFAVRLPAQGGFKQAGFQEAIDMVDSRVAACFEIVTSKTCDAVSIVEFLSAFSRGPLRTEIREYSMYFFAAHTVAAFIGPSARSIFNGATGNNFSHNVCQFRNSIIFFGSAHVERLVVNAFTGSLKNSEDAGNYVANVGDWPPRRSIALDGDFTGGECSSHKVIQNNVQAEPGGNAICGGVAHK